MNEMELGRIAYEAYCTSAGVADNWHAEPLDNQVNWHAAAVAVMGEITRRVIEDTGPSLGCFL